jgi:UDPglucose 6-dehydrogenase
MRIAMIGSGYVGLVSGACFAHFGHDVFCVDKDAGKIDRLLNARRDADLRARARQARRCNVAAGRLKFGTDLAAAVADADAVFIAVGTPSRRGDGHADLTYVYAAAKEVARAMTGLHGGRHQVDGAGRHRREIERIIAGAPGRRSSTWSPTPSSCARARRSTTSCARPRGDRHRERARARGDAAALPGAVPDRDADRLHRIETAEVIKYAANAFLATKITFINEIADLCEKVGADVHDVAAASGSTAASAGSSCTRGRATAARAFPRTRWRWRARRRTTAPLRIVEAVIAGQRRAQAVRWPRRSSPPAAARSPARPSPCWG